MDRNTQMMIFFKRLQCLIVIFFAVNAMTVVFADDIQITSAPNPVFQGQKLRVSLQTAMLVEKATLTFEDGVQIVMRKMDDRLYTANFWVPKQYPIGVHNAKINVRLASQQAMELRMRFEVASATLLSSQQRAFDAKAVDVQAMQQAELNMNIDQLEDKVDKLNRDKEALQKRMDALKNEIDRLKQEQMSKEEIEKKQKELDALRQQLESQQSAIEQKNLELSQKLAQLVEAEKRIQADRAQIDSQKKELDSRETSLNATESQLKQQKDHINLERNKLELKEKELNGFGEDIARRKAHLAALAQNLDQVKTSLDNERNQIQQRSEVIQTQESRLKLLDQDIESRQKEVQALTERFLKEQQDVSQYKKRVDKKADDLAGKEQYLVVLEQSLQQKQSDIKSMNQQITQERSAFLASQQSLKQKADRLSEQEKYIYVVEKEVKTKEKELKKLDRNLQNQQRVLVIKESEIKALEEKTKRIDQQLQDKSQQLSKKEDVLVLVEKDLKQKEAGVNKYNSQLKDQEKQLKDKEQNLNTQRVVVVQEMTQVKTLKETVDKDQKSLKKKEAQLKSEAERLEAERVKQQQQLQAEANRLAEKKHQQEIASQQKQQQLDMADQQLNQKRAEQKQQELRLTQMDQALYQKQTEVKQQLAQADQFALYIKHLSDRMDSKEKQLQALQAGLDRKDTDLKALYTQAMESDMEQQRSYLRQFQKMTDLSQTIVERARELEAVNRKLRSENQRLDYERAVLEQAIEGQYRYGISGYMGLHSFDKSRGIAAGAEGGVMFSEYFTRQFGFEVGLGFVSTKFANEQQKPGSAARIVTTYAVNTVYDYAKLTPDMGLSLLAGLAGDFETGTSVKINMGLMLKFDIKEDYFSFTGFRQNGADSRIDVGVEKRFKIYSMVSPNVYVRPTLNIPVAEPALPTATEPERVLNVTTPQIVSRLEARLMVPASRKQYIFKEKSLSDTRKHWGRAPIQELTTMGLIDGYPVSGDTKLEFNPDHYISRREAIKMAVHTGYLYQMLEETFTIIGYEISDHPQLAYSVNLVIFDSQGNKVRRLITEQLKYPGSYQVEWDGKDDKGLKVEKGLYRVQLTIIGLESRVAVEKSGAIQVMTYQQPQFRFRARNVAFSDVDAADPDRSVFNESVRMGVIRLDDDVFFLAQSQSGQIQLQPEAPLTRIEMMVAVNRILSYLGAANSTEVDFSRYRDAHNITSEMRKELTLYVSELGYGGDDLGRLLPNKQLTRSEAVMIVYRLMQWRRRS